MLRSICIYTCFSLFTVDSVAISLARVTKSYLLALGTTQISSYFTKHWLKFLIHQTGNYPVTCFVSKPSRITLEELSIINTSYQKLPWTTQTSSYFTKYWTKLTECWISWYSGCRIFLNSSYFFMECIFVMPSKNATGVVQSLFRRILSFRRCLFVRMDKILTWHYKRKIKFEHRVKFKGRLNKTLEALVAFVKGITKMWNTNQNVKILDEVMTIWTK